MDAKRCSPGETISEYTHRHLTAYHMTLNEFCELVGISRKTVGEQFNDPKPWFLDCLAAFTGADSDELRKRFPSRDEERIMMLHKLGQHYRKVWGIYAEEV